MLDGDVAWRQELAETGERLTKSRMRIADAVSAKLADMAPQLSDDRLKCLSFFAPAGISR